MKRLARNAAELMALSATLKDRGIRLELLTGALTGIYDPYGMGAMLLAVLASAPNSTATTSGRNGNHGGRPKVIDNDMLFFARTPRDQGTPVPEITKSS